MALNPMVRSEEDLEKNIRSVEKYLSDENKDAFHEMRDYIKRGACFVVYPIGNGKLGFVPSKFIGHLENTLDKHQERNFHGGGETNKTISRILNENEKENEDLEKQLKK